MIKKFFLSLLIIFLALSSKAQTVYSELALQYANEGNYEKAIELESEGLNILESIKGAKNEYYAASLHNLAWYYSSLGNFQKAIQLEMQALEICKDQLGEKHSNYINSLSSLYNYYSKIGNSKEAIKILTDLLDILELKFGKYHLEYANALNDLAAENGILGNFEEAIIIQKEALSITENILGKYTKEYVIGLNNLALLYSNIDKNKDAIHIIKEALQIIEKIFGENNEQYAITKSNLASHFAKIGNYSEALRLETEVLEVFEKIAGNTSIDLAKSLHNIAWYNSFLGNYQEALQLGIESLIIKEKVLGKNHPDYARGVANLAWYNSCIGNYTEAIRLETEALQIRKNIYGNNHLDCSGSILNLSTYFGYLGDYQEAKLLANDALKIIKEIYGTNHINFAVLLGNLAVWHAYSGNYKEAILLESEAMKIIEKVFDKNHPDYAKSIMNLAWYYSCIGNYSKAKSQITEAVKINKKILGERHPDYAACLSNLASLNFYFGNSTEAVRLGTEAMKIQKQVLSERHPSYLINLINLIVYSPKNLNEYSVIVSSNIINNIKDNFKYLPRNLRKTTWDKNKSWFEIYLPQFTYETNLKDVIQQSYNGLLISKGLLLNSEIEFEKFLAETGSQELAAKYNEIKSLKLQLNKLYEKPIAERWCDTDSLERVANNLERELMYESKEFGDYTRNLAITWEDVRDKLKEKDAAIEFVHFPLNNDSTMYTAYVLQPGVEAPELVKLFEEKELKNLVDEDDKAGIYTNKAASKLVWSKLQSSLEGVENVYFAPDGILHQIAIEYLPDCDGDGMISDRYNLHRLSSTREIPLNRHNSPTRDAVLYGGIKYDTDVKTMETESRKYEKPQNRGFNPYYNLTDSLSLRGSLDYLAGSLTEAENINDMMKENNYKITLLTDTIATEESFKNLSGKANGIIHISTHGFYWTESEAERKASHNDRLMFMSQLGENSRRNVEDKALTRTGLFMAGATNALKGDTIPEGVDDGILTAQEIANLDLRGLDLVVLSACQTGMGDISGDGVFGLQRGFKKAGANTILMSLWDVNDEATQILMTNFYKNYLDGMSKQQALREAQKTVRETPGFSDPKYWAAFILLDALN